MAPFRLPQAIDFKSPLAQLSVNVIPATDSKRLFGSFAFNTPLPIELPFSQKSQLLLPSRHKTSSRHLRIVLELSCLDKTFPRYLNIILESSYLEQIISRCLNYVSIKMASIKLLQDCYMTES